MNNRDLKLLLILFLLVGALCVMLCACSPNDAMPDISAQCVRIHIRANSNNTADQTVKLAVRDAVTEYLTYTLEGAHSKEEALTRLEYEKNSLVEIANNTLNTKDFTYKASISLKTEYFPKKSYDGYIFPAGEYDALIIELGEGTGANWWCVAFPPLCFIPDGGNGEKIVYKSWIKEKLSELFG